MKNIKTDYPHLSEELAKAFQKALDSAKTDEEKTEIIFMLEKTEEQLAENEKAGEEISSSLSVLLNGTEKRMQKIKRSHMEDKSAAKDQGNMSKILDDIKSNS